MPDEQRAKIGEANRRAYAERTKKRCNACHEILPWASFGLQPGRGTPYSRCLTCRSLFLPSRKISDEEKERLHRENRRKSLLKISHGVTPEEYEQIAALCSGLCCICGTSDPGLGSFMHLDHCHETGLLRGVLCGNCNTGIGLLGDSVDRLTAAILYLTDRKTR